jgi:hypothetical protein
MTWLRARASAGGVVLLAFSLGPQSSPVAAQSSPAAPPSPAAPAAAAPARPQKSAYGTMSAIDKSLSAVAMKTNDGKKLAWKFPPRVIAQVIENFKVGDPMIVIYRQISSSEKRVTAVAFPGSAATPIYVNTTGSRVLVRTGPMVGGVCGTPDAGPISESMLPADGLAEVQEACWCCAVDGESCTPGNKSGNGRAFLVNCFK